MQPFEYRSVRYWSKEINGTRIGGQKRFSEPPRERSEPGGESFLEGLHTALEVCAN